MTITVTIPGLDQAAWDEFTPEEQASVLAAGQDGLQSAIAVIFGRTA